jgi:hypothetical protein
MGHHLGPFKTILQGVEILKVSSNDPYVQALEFWTVRIPYQDAHLLALLQQQAYEVVAQQARGSGDGPALRGFHPLRIT